MERIRQGLNIQLKFSVWRANDEKEDFSQALDIRFWIEHDTFPNIKAYPRYSITDNIITAYINPDTTSRLGDYRLYASWTKVNIDNDPPYDRFAIDNPAFTRVQLTEQQGGQPEPCVELVVVEVSGTLDRCKDGINGASAYELWLLDEGNEGKSYEDYVAWQRQPVTDIADNFSVQYNDGVITITY